jgi:xanthine dehydrogenase accessory factor
MAMPLAAALQDAGEAATLAKAVAWQAEGKAVAIATVIACWGSAPRPAGSKLAVAADGAFAGSVSGGCVENAVITAALDCIADGVPRVLEYAGDAKFPWEVGLPCGGTIRVYVEPLSPKFRHLLHAREKGRTIALLTHLATGDFAHMTQHETGGDAKTLRAAKEILPESASGWRTQLLSAEGGDLFIDVHRPALRVLLVGATHLAQSLSAMAGLYGYDVTVIDPRAAYLTAERFAAQRLIPDSPGTAVAALRPDAATAVIAVSHDPKLDDPALIAALRSEAFYIGALGSRKSHEARCARLREAGFGEADLARIHGPVGLRIGAVSPPEIAGSILAQMTQILRNPA